MTESHDRPPGTSDETIAAVGLLTEAYEYVIRARGHLYSFHQLLGHADSLFGDAADALRRAGHAELADRVSDEVVGRNVVDGRWTFQVVEEFDDLYVDAVTDVERAVRDALVGGRRHVFESETKDARTTPGAAGHERRPPAAHDPDVDTGR